MKNGSISTISALCYAKPSRLDFSALCRELSDTLCNNPELDATQSSRSDDFVIFDMTGLRICVAFCDFRRDFADIDCFRDFAEAVVFSVGSGPDGSGFGPLYSQRSDVCRGLADRVQSYHPADELLMIEVDQTIGSDICGTLVECLVPLVKKALERSRQANQRPRQTTPGAVVPVRPAKMSGRAVQSRAFRPVPCPPEGCEEWFDRARVRTALYPTEDELPVPRLAKPLVHRAAVNALNSAVIAFSLPLGAVVLTMSILGRESLSLSAGMMGLAGASVGVTHSDLTPQILVLLT
ncbi:hypothetical protein EU803_05465 [Loktanella sp. IMCC34160]|uniref:hypothetical protein n=1 Tax=Loktanella sp. IMCC34160 TaxID=2510646 RepID=UPI00101DEE19|nr:hypothetical protein [Loktanella sp. IMCC34160]RYG91900.1 hypothetical protein EU803_05465 [Loktanella sp. IMCC34160]